MFGKLLAIVVVLAVMALALLVERQRRTETMLEISRTHSRILEQERSIARLRAEVARRIRPGDVRVALRTVAGEWVPLPNRLDRPTAPTSPRLAADRPDATVPASTPATEFGG
ncbi:MAG: hypothetical protein FJ253_01860 [Phycisphaerae bacterium]|nr:hypothetical protein [Phycisphaerae bacterium]